MTECPTCGKRVTGVHTCFDPALAVAIKDAERRVVEAAEAWLDDRSGEREWAVLEAVRALRAARGEG